MQSESVAMNLVACNESNLEDIHYKEVIVVVAFQ
jgi:hypothetical protein